MIYENCNGKIGSNGLCEKCLQPSETTSVYCLRLIPIPLPSAPGEKSEGEDELWEELMIEIVKRTRANFAVEQLISELKQSFSIKRKQ
jgi:hypothetical protein